MDISIDCFAGGGGASTGYQMATGQEITIAINHDLTVKFVESGFDMKVLEGWCK